MNATQDGLTLAADVDRDLTVAVDADRIIQVLVNLLGNAIKFSPRQATITVTAGPEQGRARFAVKDMGRGIPADRLESIFERFRQVDSSDAREMGGSGLGLAIARDIVSHHGGQMSVESEVGVGSTFYFTLPLASDAEVMAPDSERRMHERRAEERRVDERRIEERRVGERRVEDRQVGERRVEDEHRVGERRVEELLPGPLERDV
jgi:hypothetical protein